MTTSTACGRRSSRPVPAARSIHRRIAPWLALPLALLAITGLTYRLGRSWFGLDRETGWRILDVHAGEFLGDAASAFYLLAVGTGLLVLIGAGIALQFRRGGRGRWIHRVLGLVLCLPLLASVTTGLAYKLGEEWFGISEQTQDALMHIHEGAWLGGALKPYYVLLLGFGVLALAASGLRLFRWRSRARS